MAIHDIGHVAVIDQVAPSKRVVLVRASFFNVEPRRIAQSRPTHQVRSQPNGQHPTSTATTHKPSTSKGLGRGRATQRRVQTFRRWSGRSSAKGPAVVRLPTTHPSAESGSYDRARAAQGSGNVSGLTGPKARPEEIEKAMEVLVSKRWQEQRVPWLCDGGGGVHNGEEVSVNNVTGDHGLCAGYLIDCAGIDAHARPFAHGALQEETCARRDVVEWLGATSAQPSLAIHRVPCPASGMVLLRLTSANPN